MGHYKQSDKSLLNLLCHWNEIFMLFLVVIDVHFSLAIKLIVLMQNIIFALI